jgi:AraC-like DNA-binding protein
MGLRLMDWRALILVPGLVHGAVVAVLLLGARPRRSASILLAALLLLLGVELLPQVLGLAGFFDGRPDLWYAPLAVGWGIPAAAWLYVRAILGGRWRGALLAHFAPLAVLVGYRAWLFAQPLPSRLDWARRWHEPLLGHVEDGVTHLLAVAYLWAALSLFRRRQREIARTRSDADRFALAWLRGFLVGGLALLVVSLGQAALTVASGRPGDGGFAYTAFLALSLYALSIAGYGARHVQVPAVDPLPTEPEPPSPRPHLERLLSRAEAALVETELFRRPSLTLAELAAAAGASPATLSRALSLVGGVNFATFVNRRRVEWAAGRLADPADRRTVLDVGLAAGFSAKATFNRVFRETLGRTPLEHRKATLEVASAPVRASQKPT